MDILQSFQGKRICVAISGGVDSTALLHYLQNASDKGGYALCAVHCEHGIRGEESLRDQAFVQSLCQKWGVELYTFSCDCVERAKAEKCSLETAARNFRRACFAQLIAEKKADYIATAHHILDEAETVLFRLARGTALHGASAIKACDGYFLRPFLTWSKEKILAYAQEHNLQFCVDSTNFEVDATRNKIRLEVLPVLSQAVDGAVENLARFARVAEEDDALLYTMSEQLLTVTDDGYAVAFDDRKPLFTRACLLALKKMGVARDYTGAHLQSLYALQALERGAKISLPCGIIAEKRKQAVAFFVSLEEQVNDKRDLVVPFTENGFDGGRYAVNIAFQPPMQEQSPWKTLKFDLDKLPDNAVFRFRRAGDTIQSFGGKKTLKKFLNEREIAPNEREFLPLIAQETGEQVYVVCGVEIAKSVCVDENTKRVAYVTIQKK